MYECEECNKSSSHSAYHFPIIDEKDGKRKLLHIECCEKESLLNFLRQKVETEKLFYEDASKLLEEFTNSNIKKFEKKYGTFDELRNGIEIDKFSEILAIIDQIKKIVRKS